ncbi:FHA domain-containing protein [Sandaracinus amylolyticus]|uniref:FHA domain-containing protein n=1 Tax=Sandaracinus amylolyticus TaxID=927083 RepID=UPI00146FD616|nr:FHA domain-containing protein [Sandaracinus amylolyticus]
MPNGVSPRFRSSLVAIRLQDRVMARFRLRLQDREIALPAGGELVVGRDATVADVALDDRLVSRRHAAFRCHGDDELEIVDLESLNGVRVNDVPVKGVRALGHRDRVQIGAHVFLVVDQRREHRSNAPTTRGSMRTASATRPTPRAQRAIVTPLDTIAQALADDDLSAAVVAMDAVIARYGDPSEALMPGELGRVVELLLALSERTGDMRFFDRVFQIHTGRRLVIDGASIDAIQNALPHLERASSQGLDTYLAAMGARGATLSPQEQVRLRRIAALTRRVGKGKA